MSADTLVLLANAPCRTESAWSWLEQVFCSRGSCPAVKLKFLAAGTVDREVDVMRSPRSCLIRSSWSM